MHDKKGLANLLIGDFFHALIRSPCSKGQPRNNAIDSFTTLSDDSSWTEGRKFDP
jgi:hypothetical protein